MTILTTLGAGGLPLLGLVVAIPDLKYINTSFMITTCTLQHIHTYTNPGNDSWLLSSINCDDPPNSLSNNGDEVLFTSCNDLRPPLADVGLSGSLI